MDNNPKHSEAFLLISVPSKRAGHVVEQLTSKHSPSIVEAHAIWGSSDVIAKVTLLSPSLLADLVMEKIQNLEHVERTQTYLLIEGMSFFTKAEDTAQQSKGRIRAFIFLNVEPTRSKEIAKLLIKCFPDKILEAHAAWGGADVILKVSVSDILELQQLIMNDIQGREFVNVTRTHIIIPDMSKFTQDLHRL